MWQLQAMLALDVARERTRQAEADAFARRAHDEAAAEGRAHVPAVTRPGAGRTVAAAALRRVSAWFESASDATCEAAARLEGRAA